MVRISTPRVFILVYFVGMTGGFIWLLANSEIWCTKSDEALPKAWDEVEKQNKERAEDNARKKLADRVSYLEAQLRIHFPHEVDAILSHTDDDIPYIYAITPTYDRLVQKAELTRLCHTFLHVRNFHWIVVEDSKNKTKKVTDLLHSSGLKYTHLTEATPLDFKLHANDPNWLKPRGVPQRNRALQWIIENQQSIKVPSVLYFADDDNTYSLQVFEEMRYTDAVSVWPVGMVGKMLYESPTLDANNKVVGWHTYWHPERSFASDMAGFAISMSLFLHHPDTRFNIHSVRGNMESDFISQFGITLQDLQPKADHCTKILVWHTRTEEPNLRSENKLKQQGKGSDPNIEI